MTLIEVGNKRWINVDEIAALEDIDPGAGYSTQVTRSRVTLRSGSTVGSALSVDEILEKVKTGYHL